uniref:ATP synthase F0 subunit 8 n=1 Tax=Bisetocreagris titanium TaxID=2836860 RepID=A0A8F7PUR1_9ARAC|nr:ATP synthase F0 subunit 8 [Bisetocreagris titanium]
MPHVMPMNWVYFYFFIWFILMNFIFMFYFYFDTNKKFLFFNSLNLTLKF